MLYSIASTPLWVLVLFLGERIRIEKFSREYTKIYINVSELIDEEYYNVSNYYWEYDRAQSIQVSHQI